MAEQPAKPDEAYVSISFLRKNPDISHEEFYHHWEKVHGPLVKPWAKKHGFISYKQVRKGTTYWVRSRERGTN